MPRWLSLVSLLVVAACSSSSTPSSDGPSAASNPSPGGTGTIAVACNHPAKSECGSLTVRGEAAAQAARDMCTMRGDGIVVALCPSANLIGCCTQSIVKNCFYMGPDSSATEARCTAGRGTWSTTP